MSELATRIGNAIKVCRVQRGMSQQELAQNANISVSYLSLLERGKRDPVFSTIQDIAGAMQVPVPILVFMATRHEDDKILPQDLREKLADAILRLMQPETEPTS